METRLLTEGQTSIAAEIINGGGLVAARTETVYGLCADATNADAVNKIFVAKGRPSDNPLIVHFSGIKMLAEYFDLSELQQRLLSIPSLTLLLPFDSFKLPVAQLVTGGNPNVAVRIPSCRFTRKLIDACGVPLAAPSANTSTRPSPTTWEAVQEDLTGKIDAIVKGGCTKCGVESTVVQLDNNKLVVLRHGAVPANKLTELTGLDVVDSATFDQSKQSPGTRFLHYAPCVPMLLAKNSAGLPEMIVRIHKFAKTTPAVVIAPTKHKKFYDLPIILLGKNPKQIYRRFYTSIRRAEKLAMQLSPETVIIMEDLPHDKVFETLHDRIQKATQGRVI